MTQILALAMSGTRAELLAALAVIGKPGQAPQCECDHPDHSVIGSRGDMVRGIEHTYGATIPDTMACRKVHLAGIGSKVLCGPCFVDPSGLHA